MTEAKIIHGDCVATMLGMERGSVDLVFGSPPYEDARTYGMGFKLKGQDWVDWMVEVFRASLHVSRGLVAMVLEGRTRNYRWSATPALLMADLHRAGITLRKPPAFHRVGVCGSGGPDWLRNDYEFIVCATNGGKLAWSDNTAMGHVPKWAPGGEMSNRLSNGSRRNQWGGSAKSTGGERGKNGTLREAKPRPSHRVHTKRDAAAMREQYYNAPDLANPGNVICGIHSLSIVDIMVHYAYSTKTDPGSILRDLRGALDSQTLLRWWAGIVAGIFQAEILQSAMQGPGADQGDSDQRREGARSEAGESQDKANEVRDLWKDGSASSASSGRRSNQQCGGQSPGSMPLVPPQGTQEDELLCSRLYESFLGEGILLAALPEIQAARESVDASLQAWNYPAASNVVKCLVGGGVMGDRLAHLNEAPFPEKLAEFFIRSFCPPDGTVLEPFSGSGTTAKVAIGCGRNAIAIDIRECEIKKTKRRVACVQTTFD